MKNLLINTKINTHKLVSIWLLAFVFILAIQAQRPRQPRVPVVVSPEVTTDNKVTFRLHSKEATSVTLTGDWMAD